MSNSFMLRFFVDSTRITIPFFLKGLPLAMGSHPFRFEVVWIMHPDYHKVCLFMMLLTVGPLIQLFAFGVSVIIPLISIMKLLEILIEGSAN